MVASIVPITHDFQISVAQVAPDGDGADKRHARRTSQAPGKCKHSHVPRVLVSSNYQLVTFS